MNNNQCFIQFNKFILILLHTKIAFSFYIDIIIKKIETKVSYNYKTNIVFISIMTYNYYVTKYCC